MFKGNVDHMFVFKAEEDDKSIVGEHFEYILEGNSGSEDTF